MPATKRAMDFTNVKDRGNFNPRHREAGDYVMKIVSVDDHTSKAGNDGWVFTCVIADEAKSARPSTYPYHCGSDEDQAWKIRKLFIACGSAVPKKRVMVDPNKLLNKTFGAALDDDEYEGKMKSVIVDTFPEDEVEQEEPEEETKPVRRSSKTPAKKATSRKKAAEPADDEDADDEDIDELDLEEL